MSDLLPKTSKRAIHWMVKHVVDTGIKQSEIDCWLPVTELEA